MSTSSSSIERSTARFWQRIAASVAVPAESLGVFRCIWGLYQLFFNTPNYTWIGSAPRAFFDPPVLSTAYVFGRFPPRPFFVLLDVVVLMSLCCIIVGYHTLAATAALLVARVIGDSFLYSFGYLGHDGFMYAILLCMLIADWGRHFSLDSLRRQKKPPSDPAAMSRGVTRGLALLAVLLSFGFLAAGLPKALNWLNFDLSKSGILMWYYSGRYSTGRTYLLAGWVPGTPRLLLKMGDWAAPLLECCGFIALLWSRRTWLLWLLAITLFQLINVFVLNIEFASWAITYLVFVDLSSVAHRVNRRRLRQILVGSLVVGIVVAAWHLISRLNGAGSGFAFVGPGRFLVAWDLYSSIPPFLLVSVVLGLAVARTRKSTALQPVPPEA